MKMRLLLFLNLISYSFGVTPEYKPKIEAKIVMSKDMFRSYSGDSRVSTVHLEITIPQSLANALGLQMKNKKALRLNPHQGSQSTWHRDLRAVPELVNYLTKTNRLRFQSMIEKYYKVLVKGITHVEITSEVNATLSAYKLKFHKHINDLLKEDPENQVDKDLILLDIIDTSNTLLYKGTLVSLQIMIDGQFSKGPVSIKTVTDEIFKKTLRKKKQDLTLLCTMTHICRPFPGFSEYLVDLLEEVINLSESKLHAVVMKTIVILKNKQADIVKILGEPLVENLGKHFQIIAYDELSVINKVLSEKRMDILERYRWKKLTETKKAFRMVLDMIDKAFVSNKSNEVAEHFIVTIKALHNWTFGDTINIGEVLNTFFNYMVKTITANWRNDTCEEARRLIQITLGGHLNIQDKYQYLLTNGSNYLNKII